MGYGTYTCIPIVAGFYKLTYRWGVLHCIVADGLAMCNMFDGMFGIQRIYNDVSTRFEYYDIRFKM